MLRRNNFPPTMGCWGSDQCHSHCNCQWPFLHSLCELCWKGSEVRQESPSQTKKCKLLKIFRDLKTALNMRKPKLKFTDWGWPSSFYETWWNCICSKSYFWSDFFCIAAKNFKPKNRVVSVNLLNFRLCFSLFLKDGWLKNYSLRFDSHLNQSKAFSID